MLFTTGGRAWLAPHTILKAVIEYAGWLQSNEGAALLAANLRRCRTRLVELGVSKHIRAQLLSHGISGVQSKHYDPWSYLPEKRAALEKWERYLDGLLDPRKVIDLAGRKKQRG